MMNVAKWGNSLAVRLPRNLVAELGLQPGDQIKIVAASPDQLELVKDTTREDALARIRSRKWPPNGVPLSRDEANER
jgi:antitoxin MazE